MLNTCATIKKHLLLYKLPPKPQSEWYFVSLGSSFRSCLCSCGFDPPLLLPWADYPARGDKVAPAANAVNYPAVATVCRPPAACRLLAAARNALWPTSGVMNADERKWKNVCETPSSVKLNKTNKREGLWLRAQRRRGWDMWKKHMHITGWRTCWDVTSSDVAGLAA